MSNPLFHPPGLGLGLTYTATNITVGFYFERLRGLASGVSNSMQAIGILSGSVIFQALMDTFGVSGMFMLLGATSLHFCFFGMFFRPSIYEGKSYDIVVKEQEKHCAENQSHDLDASIGATVDTTLDLSTTDDACNAVEAESKSLLKGSKNSSCAIQNDVISSAPIAPEVGSEVKNSVVNVDVSFAEASIATVVILGENINKDVHLEIRTVHSENSGAAASEYGESEYPDSSVPLLTPNNQQEAEQDSQPAQVKTPEKTCHVLNRDSLNTSVSQYPSNYTSNSASQNSSQQFSYTTDVPTQETKRMPPAGFVRDAQKRTRSCKGRSWKSGCFANYVVLLSNRALMLHCASLFVSSIHVAGVFLHLPEYAHTHGTTPTQSAELFVAVGSFSLLSKLSSGFAMADPDIDPLILSVGMMGLNGISTCLFPLYADSFTKQMVFSSLFGMYFGGLYALINPILVRLAGVARLADAYGISLFSLGLGYMMGPTLAAMIVDGGGSYNLSFLFLGVMMLSGAFLDMGAACFLQLQHKENDDISIQDND